MMVIATTTALASVATALRIGILAHKDGSHLSQQFGPRLRRW